MSESPLQTVERINSRLATLLKEARGALGGEREFGVENVRQLSATVEEMAPILACSSELCSTQPEITAALDAYKSQLRNLQTIITHIRVMLLLRRSQMEAGRAHVQSVSQWAHTLNQTRP